MNAITLSFAATVLLVGVTFAKSPLKELASDPDCQIVYNEKVGEYQLKWKIKTEDGYSVKAYPLKFDPFTGDPLESRRDELFTEPSREEIMEIHKKLSQCKTIEDVISAFGEPDRVWPINERRKKAQYDFYSAFDTTKLVVHVSEDGSLKSQFSGKQIKRSVNEE